MDYEPQPATESEHARISHRRVLDLHHPPVNEQIYRPVSRDDPEVRELARSIKTHGVMEPLVVSLDDHVLSGNRRLVAAGLAGLETVPCRVEDVTLDDPLFPVKLREHNRQRLKSAEEQAREAVIGIDPNESHRLLVQYRQARTRVGSIDSMSIEIEGRADRARISKAKLPMLRAAMAVIEERRDFWPLTTRQVHYALLNDPPLKHASKPQSRYRNDRTSYNDLCDLLLRARLEGWVTWDAIDDPTRPIEVWNVHRGVGSFVHEEVEDFLKYYYRDLQQSQPLHIEVVGEKNTVANILRPVAGDYCVPLTLGRGYASGSPRKKMADRFRASGRDVLALLVLSDFDPEGEDIPQAFARSLRDEFGLGEDRIRLVKVALTADQVEELNLPPVMQAKEGSSRRRKFVARHGETVHELEAVQPEQMQALLREAIESVMDVEAYQRELQEERKDSAELSRLRASVLAAISNLQP